MKTIDHEQLLNRKITNSTFSMWSHVLHYIVMLALVVIGLVLYNGSNVTAFIDSIHRVEIFLILTVTGYFAVFSQIFSYIYKHRNA